MAVDISMGLRREDRELKRDLEAAIAASRPQIDAILAAYGVPRLDPPRAAAGIAPER
jgi:mxaJ protein